MQNGRVATDELSPAFQGRVCVPLNARRVATTEKEIPMANTYTSLHYHITFSTKNREPWIVPKIESRVWRYIGGIARANTR